MKLLGLSKVASQYIGEIMGGGQYSYNCLFLATCFNINLEALTATHFIDFSSASGSCLYRTLVLQHSQEGCQEKVVLLKLPRKKLYF